MRNMVQSLKFSSRAAFTLLELMVTVAIIGILAAISGLQLQQYRSRAFDREAQVALRMVVIAEQAYFIDNSTYVSCDETTCPLLLPGITAITNGVSLSFVSAGATANATASHVKGTGQVFNWSN